LLGKAAIVIDAARGIGRAFLALKRQRRSRHDKPWHDCTYCIAIRLGDEGLGGAGESENVSHVFHPVRPSCVVEFFIAFEIQIDV
jgi:hypothetical protein